MIFGISPDKIWVLQLPLFNDNLIDNMNNSCFIVLLQKISKYKDSNFVLQDDEKTEKKNGNGKVGEIVMEMLVNAEVC